MFGVGPRALEWLAAGALVTGLGALVKFAGWTWLLAGYSESTSPVPETVVRDVAGNTLLRVGVALLAFGVLAGLMALPSYFDLVLGGAIVLAVARLVYRLNTWSPNQTT